MYSERDLTFSWKYISNENYMILKYETCDQVKL